MRLLDRDTWVEVAQSLGRHRVRTLLTALGVVWGMFMLVVMLAFGAALQTGILRSMGGLAAGTAFVWPSRTTMSYRGRAPGRFVSIDIDDLAAIEQGVPGLVAVSPFNRVGVRDDAQTLVTRHGTKIGAEVLGESDAMHEIRPTKIVAGRLMNPLDVTQRRKVAFMGRRAHRKLFGDAPPQDAVGAAIAVEGIEFTVVGVFAIERSDDDAAEQERSVVIPWTTLARTFGPKDRVDSVAIRAAAGVDSVHAAKQVQALLRRRHAVHPDDALAYELWSFDAEAANVRSLFVGIEALVWIVGGATLLAGALGVANVTFVTVRERTREFGLRKALGATSSTIVVQVMLEAMVLTVGAGYLGVLLAAATVEVVAAVLASLPIDQRPEMLASPVVELGTAFAGLVVLCVAGLVASFLPSRAAASVDPARVLQAE
ncbi:MAG: ABC transporter permease [Myxococcota bacterium]